MIFVPEVCQILWWRKIRQGLIKGKDIICTFPEAVTSGLIHPAFHSIFFLFRFCNRMMKFRMLKLSLLLLLLCCCCCRSTVVTSSIFLWEDTHGEEAVRKDISKEFIMKNNSEEFVLKKGCHERICNHNHWQEFITSEKSANERAGVLVGRLLWLSLLS